MRTEGLELPGGKIPTKWLFPGVLILGEARLGKGCDHLIWQLFVTFVCVFGKLCCEGALVSYQPSKAYKDLSLAAIHFRSATHIP